MYSTYIQQANKLRIEGKKDGKGREGEGEVDEEGWIDLARVEEWESTSNSVDTPPTILLFFKTLYVRDWMIVKDVIMNNYYDEIICMTIEYCWNEFFNE